MTDVAALALHISCFISWWYVRENVRSPERGRAPTRWHEHLGEMHKKLGCASMHRSVYWIIRIKLKLDVPWTEVPRRRD